MTTTAIQTTSSTRLVRAEIFTSGAGGSFDHLIAAILRTGQPTRLKAWRRKRVRWMMS